jgi:hypothetical protein
MKTSHLTFASLASALLLAGCGDSGGTATPTDAGADGGRRAIGMITVNGRMGVGYDTDGNSDAEGVDFDGDGVLDGEDLDGDGVITVWGDFRSATVPSPETSGMPSIDPDLFSSLDPSNPPENVGTTGEVMEPARVVNDLPAGTLISRSQGNQGSCAAFTVGATATLIRQHYARIGMPMATPPLNTDAYWASTAWLYTRMVARSSTMMCNGGTALVDGLDLLATTGAATWMEQPYRSGTMPMLCEPISDTTATTPHVFRIGSYARVTGTGMAYRNRVRESLAAGLPVPFGAQLPNGFMDWKSSTPGVTVTDTFRGTGMCTTSGHCGGHGMVITGYDDMKGAYRVLNSWGTDWGDRGYIWWDYASLEGLMGLQTYVVLPLPTAPTALAAPNPAGLTMTQPMGSRVALVQQDGSWNLITRVLFNEPVVITTVRTEINGSALNYRGETGMEYGDLVAAAPGDAMPATGATANITVTARLRNGMSVDRMLTVMVPAPTTL